MKLRSSTPTAPVRAAAVKHPGLKQSVLASVQATKELATDVLERLHLHNKAVKTCPAATEEELDELWSMMKDIDPDDSTQEALRHR